MYDADAIEAINFEQLVTVTDRMLLRGSRMPKRRPSTNRIGPPLVLDSASADSAERTVIVKRPKRVLDATTIMLGSAIVVVLMCIATLA
jgi:hypothetical protein